MGWRPIGWKNPHKSKEDWTKGAIGQDIVRPILYDAIAEGAYEAGADAILEALKKEGGCCNKDEPIIPFDATFMKGWLVFIPDETG